MKKEEVTLPKTSITPAQGKILCKPFLAEEKKTESGIYLLTNKTFGKDRDKDFSVEKHRYVVVAVGKLNDQVHVQEEDGKFRDIRRGDEVHWYIPQTAIGVDWAIVTDFDTEEDLIMFHETELSGAQAFIGED